MSMIRKTLFLGFLSCFLFVYFCLLHLCQCYTLIFVAVGVKDPYLLFFMCFFPITKTSFSECHETWIIC